MTPDKWFLYYEKIVITLKEQFDILLEESYEYFRESAHQIGFAILGYLLFCAVFYYVCAYARGTSERGTLKGVKRVLFITAHPDDECMFFGPVILKLSQRRDCELFLLCLSTGNKDNKGSIRKNEIWASCEILGIPEGNVTICQNSLLPDDPNVHWKETVIADLILRHVESLVIDTVITFDKLGVSRHANHSSIFYATAFLCMEKKLPKYSRAYALDSINILRKYSSFLDAPISYLLSSYWYIVTWKEAVVIQGAMKAHKSQYVWYRKLFVTFSRYVIINTLKEIEIVDLELDLLLNE
ncbi:N-acetylglucosaminyl-phosphatidylinositol de-N-acetylase [Ischnura elegans]|uniref:N-acetylglucosaminyl-phosphatidylinositol de-N-acetylase n=1 Tax=Ischnura elegans TaxID=197161 RepID=UPI001ED8916B|nr:N-acetylglucosaminyl-phosphatidylinositol de-N-acetylase [Ischnura elegans]